MNIEVAPPAPLAPPAPPALVTRPALHLVAPTEGPPSLLVPDPSDSAAVVAYLCALLRTAPPAQRAIEAQREFFVQLAARLPDASVEWAELRLELQQARVDLRAFARAVKNARAAQRTAAAAAVVAEARARAASPAASEAELARALALELQTNAYGQPKSHAANLFRILSGDPRWKDRLAYHALREIVVLVAPVAWHPDETPTADPSAIGEWSEQHSVSASSWMSRNYELDAGTNLVTEVIETVARRKILDPVKDYFLDLSWDLKSRLETWLSVYLGAPQDDYTSAIGMRWLMSAVARTFEPGCQVDCVLVLEGKQGTGKSSALRSLCFDESWFFDDDLEIGNAQAVGQAIRGKLILELGELSALSRHDLAQVKAAITRRADTYRQSYGRKARDFPRRCIFAASTNEDVYFADDENRRFWPVKTCVINLAALLRDRDQLWAEAVALYQGGMPWHVDTPELAALCRGEQERRARPDPWEAFIIAWLQARTTDHVCCASAIGEDRCECVTCHGVTTPFLLREAIDMPRERQDTRAEMRCAAILKRLGWAKGQRVLRDGERVRPFFPSLAAADRADYRREWAQMSSEEQMAERCRIEATA